ncbi:MAG: SUMF1/EgtB/PvdO family nonheme iron enzyme [Planctomycetes bacterium]|nr:SUMF1/EgtB/PvdO family nonheme iron enzyme [Planctomycetota bacterium]
MEDAPTEQTPPAETQAPAGMVEVPAGPFRFGRGRGREASLGRFWIDTTPVTNADYLRFVDDHHRPAPRHWPREGLPDELLELPVVYVTYAEAEAYAEALGKRLPTPAQFEKAARGTEGLRYPWGNGLRARATNTRETGLGQLESVHAFPRGASPYGCLDLAGNVLHWTRTGDGGDVRVLKGGSFLRFVAASAWSDEAPQEARLPDLGFRCVWLPG